MKTEPWPAARGLRASYSLEFQRAFLQNEPNFLTPSQSVGCKIPVVAGSPAHADAREPLMAWYRQVRGEGDRLDVLVTLVEAWEREHYPMNLPDRWRRSSTIWIRMGCSLATSFLSSAVATACTVLNRRRSLTLKNDLATA